MSRTTELLDGYRDNLLGVFGDPALVLVDDADGLEDPVTAGDAEVGDVDRVLGRLDDPPARLAGRPRRPARAAVALAQDHVTLTVQFDLALFLGVEEHAVTGLHGPHVRADRGHPGPREPAVAHDGGRRDGVHRRRGVLAVIHIAG